MEKTKLEWAEYLAGRGLRIVPLHHTKADGSFTCGRPNKPADPSDRVKGVDYCGSPGKHPNVNAWEEVATTDTDLIKQWFRSDPEMNYGCVAGQNGFILDIDVKDADGYDTAARLLGISRGELDRVTFSVKTPSGGEHLYFTADKVYSNTVKTALGEGLDNRSGNGFVVGPGSMLHIPEEFEPDNFVPVSYRVVNDKAFEPLPDTIKTRMREAMVRAENAQESLDPDTIDSDDNLYLAREYLKARKPAVEGQGGDEHTKSTSQGVRDFNISEEVCYDLMLELFNDKCEPPWDPDELKRKVENGYKYADRPMGTRRAVKTSLSADFNAPVQYPDGFWDKPTPKADESDDDDFDQDETEKIEYVFFDGSAVLSVDKHYDFIVDGWLPSKNYTIVLGSRGSGKTTVIVDAVCHIASDAPWYGTDIDPGWHIIYIAGEDFEGVKDRYEAWCSQHPHMCRYNEELERFEIKDPSRIQFIDMAVDLMDKKAVNAFGNAVVELARSKLDKNGKPAKVAFVIDTWQRMTSGAVGGQSSDESMQLALNNIEKLAKNFKGPCIIAAHPPKANQNTMAGSGIIENRSDAVWNIEHSAGDGIRNAEVTRVKGAKEGSNKRLKFTNVEINGFDRFGRRRKSVAVEFRGGGENGDPSKNISTPEEVQRNQEILSLVRDMLARRNEYSSAYKGDPTQVNLTKMVMDLYEDDAVLVAENKLGNAVIRKEWMEALRALGFDDDKMKRTRATRLATNKHPFYVAIDRLQYAYRGQGEIGTSGMGIRWSKSSKAVKLSFGAIEKPTMLDKVEGLEPDEVLDPHTGEIVTVEEAPVENDDDFGSGDI